MDEDYAIVEGHLSLQDFVDEYVLRTGRRCFVVVQGDRVSGLITPHEVKNVDRDNWRQTSVQSVMRPLGQLLSVAPRLLPFFLRLLALFFFRVIEEPVDELALAFFIFLLSDDRLDDDAAVALHAAVICLFRRYECRCRVRHRAVAIWYLHQHADGRELDGKACSNFQLL